MRKSILSTVAVLGLAGALSACDSEQPDPGCIVQDASFANWWAKFDPVDEPQGTCEGFEPLVGDQFGVWKFADPVANTSILVLRPLSLAALGKFDTDNTPAGFDKLQATGNLTIDKDPEEFCTADGFSVAGVEATEGDFAAEPQSISYQFGKVRVYSSPSAPGTQMTGELTYSVNGCTAHYVMRAIWPATWCDPSLDPNVEENFPSTCGEGSGLNPDFAVTCDPEVGWCVPSNKIPSFK